MKKVRNPSLFLPFKLILLIILGVVLAACDLQKEKIFTVGIINVIPGLDKTLEGFKSELSKLGYIEGVNIRYVYNESTTDMTNLPEAVNSLLAAKVDLVLSITTPATLAIQQATVGTNLPVVFIAVTDPLGAKIVESIQHPGGNITGIAFGVQEARRLEWLVRITPKIKMIYAPFNPNDKAPISALKVVRRAATELGVELITPEVTDSVTLHNAVFNIPHNADAVFLFADSLLSTQGSDLVNTANKNKLPTSSANIDSLYNYPILTTFGPDLRSYGQQAARLVDMIFKGANPADLPVETVEFAMGINLKVAKTIGLTIPDKILLQADIILR